MVRSGPGPVRDVVRGWAILAAVTWPVKVRETAAEVFGERTQRWPVAGTLLPDQKVAGGRCGSRWR